MGFIGDNPREIEFEPLPDEAPIPAPAPAPAPAPEREPEEVPA